MRNVDLPLQSLVVVDFDENGALLEVRVGTRGRVEVKDIIVSTGKETVRVCHVESCEIEKNSEWGVESLGHEMRPTLCTF